MTGNRKLSILTGNDPKTSVQTVLGRILRTFSDLKPSVVDCSIQVLDLEMDPLYHP